MAVIVVRVGRRDAALPCPAAAVPAAAANAARAKAVRQLRRPDTASMLTQRQRDRSAIQAKSQPALALRAPLSKSTASEWPGAARVCCLRPAFLARKG